MKRTLATFAAALLLGATAGCSADSARPGWGPGAMGNSYGPGMMGGWGPGYGMGPGMMGPGMMGPGMMGPGMGGYGWGPGGALPDLSADQQGKLAEIHRDLRAKQWPLMEKMHELMWADTSADAAARSNYDAVAALHKQMFENSLEARKRIDGVLTPEQRQQLRRGPAAR